MIPNVAVITLEIERCYNCPFVTCADSGRLKCIEGVELRPDSLVPDNCPYNIEKKPLA